MSAQLTAASFGRLASAPAMTLHDPAHKADCVRALLRMVVQASVVLAKAYASLPTISCMDRIFFAGGFVGAEDNRLARQMISESMRNVGGRAIFCRHSEFLGALGSLSACLHRRAGVDGTSDEESRPWSEGATRLPTALPSVNL
uniref:Uncharacterized protein n=1 Tax=Haptolina ericina TaxID=156174 RepID=A0A7S3AIC0_9EUKA|mmetsp:Transcript_16915/g.37963  ORF Transcript_16915/g.37963 Transcript_16915/m.37963 type:complete len:144 (+) Transcript_16915:342-773(+)